MFWPIVRIFVLLFVLKLSSLHYPFIDTYYFKNSCSGFHQASKREKTLKTTRPQAERFHCFRAFGNLMKPEARVFEFTSPTKKNVLMTNERANKAEKTILSARYTTKPGLQGPGWSIMGSSVRGYNKRCDTWMSDRPLNELRSLFRSFRLIFWITTVKDLESWRFQR